MKEHRTPDILSGRCLCGAVRFEITPPILWSVCCHCESCRRQTGSPFTCFVGIADGQWRWSAGEARINRSSPNVERTFCADCGSPLSFRSGNSSLSGHMHFHLTALDDPERFPPKRHVAWEEKLCWLKLADESERLEGPHAFPR